MQVHAHMYTTHRNIYTLIFRHFCFLVGFAYFSFKIHKKFHFIVSITSKQICICGRVDTDVSSDFTDLIVIVNGGENESQCMTNPRGSLLIGAEERGLLKPGSEREVERESRELGGACFLKTFSTYIQVQRLTSQAAHARRLHSDVLLEILGLSICHNTDNACLNIRPWEWLDIYLRAHSGW